MKTRIVIVIGTIMLMAFSAVVFVAAQGGPDQDQRMRRGGGMPPPPPFGVPDVEHLTKVLGLSEAQASELTPFLEAERATVDALMKKLGDSHHQIEDATRDGHFDETQVRTLAAQQVQAQVDLTVEQERIKAKIFNVLTPEQRTKAAQMHRHGPGGPGGPRGPGGPPPPPPTPDN